MYAHYVGRYLQMEILGWTVRYIGGEACENQAPRTGMSAFHPAHV